MPIQIDSTVTLNNGVEIPRFGLGVWKANQQETRDSVLWALECGYRLIDTAQIYGNEAVIGETLQTSPWKRDEIFITTKLWTADHSKKNCLQAFDKSLSKLRLDYVDLYLSHFPVTGKRLETWKTMETLLQSDRCRAIGVSNYTIEHLEELIRETDIVPAINQVEFHPFLYQKELLQYCREKGIQLEAYSPLTHGVKLGDPTISQIATSHKKSVAQVMIRWGLQHNLVVIPKSVTKNRITENSEVFDFSLSEEEMKTLDNLDENLRTCWDPTGTP